MMLSTSNNHADADAGGEVNVIGGVGLVLALIGFTIEISKMVFS